LRLQQALDALRHEADQVVCPSAVGPLFSIGQSYEDFSPISGSFAKHLLDEQWSDSNAEVR